jgi:hypothetical protein
MRSLRSKHPMAFYARHCAEANQSMHAIVPKRINLIALSTALQRRFAELSTTIVVQMT